MTSRRPTDSEVDELIALVSDERDADLIHYFGPIERPVDNALIDACAKRRRRTNVILILVTTGGDADAAYRISRCLQYSYTKFFVYVTGYCKSAGTLVALGAHELIISDHGELGPLDVQMHKKDEIWETQSGLTVMDALAALQDNAFNAFEKFFLDIKSRSGGTITLKTSAQIATDMTAGIFSPLYGQLDPLHIGEAARAMSIAGHYGRRLLGRGGNIGEDALQFIMSAYPSHGFVIDRREAGNFFDQVHKPTPNERALAEKLGFHARWPQDWKLGGPPPFRFLSEEPDERESDQPVENTGETDDEKPREAEGAGFGRPVEDSREEPAGSHGDGQPVTEPDISPKAAAG